MPFKSIVILVLFSTSVTNTIQTSFVKTFHVTLKSVVVLELLVALLAVDRVDGVHIFDMMSQRNPVFELFAADLTHLNVISVSKIIVCFQLSSVSEQFSTR